MIVVAVVAVAIGSEMTRQRWASYRKKAAGFANLEQGMLQMAGATDAKVARLKREAGELKDKARRARDHPDIQRLCENSKSCTVSQSLNHAMAVSPNTTPTGRKQGHS